jgi:hypothetical protein
MAGGWGSEEVRLNNQPSIYHLMPQPGEDHDQRGDDQESEGGDRDLRGEGRFLSCANGSWRSSQFRSLR